MTPDQDERQPLVPPTPPRVEHQLPVKRNAILPTFAVILLLSACVYGGVKQGSSNLYEVFGLIIYYPAAMPLSGLSALTGCAGIIQCVKQRNLGFNLIIAIVITVLAIGLLLVPSFQPMYQLSSDGRLFRQL